MKEVREPAVAGMFYSGSKPQLQDDVNILLDKTELKKEFGKITGIVAPHAGYVYSGLTAAYAFSAIKNKGFEHAIVLSPSHREYFPGSCIYDGDAYKTPLGEIEVNKNVRDELIEGSETIFAGFSGHGQEHALEVMLPFLQTVLEDFSLTPIVMGDQGNASIEDLSNQLLKVVDEKTVIVASSDLSHFYSRETADHLDGIVETHINNFDYSKLQNDLAAEKCFACGGGLIVTLLKTAEKLEKKNSEVLFRTDSGTVTGDTHEVVGYLSSVVY